ncbi:MAG: hypothetical protein ACODAD_15145 [Planctomycetota bacterium]
MTRFTPLVFTSLAFLGILAYAVPALASPGRWQREYERHRKGTVRQQRERELDAVRHSTKRAKEELRHWYQAERNELQADFDRARERLRGRDWSDYVRRYSDDRADLTRYYADQRRALVQEKVEAEKNIRDHYQRLERRIEGRDDTHCYGHGRHRRDRSSFSRPGHRRPRSHARPPFRLQLPWLGLSVP